MATMTKKYLRSQVYRSVLLILIGSALLAGCIPSRTGTDDNPPDIAPASKATPVKGAVATNQHQESVEPQIHAHPLYVPTLDGGRWGLVDDSGALITAPHYKQISSFHKIEDGSHLAAVQGENDLWGYINERGEERIATQFSEARGFTEMFVARIEQDGKWGFIAGNGDILIPPQYEMASPMTNGFAAVKKDNQAFFIDKAGTPLGSEKFARLGTFNGNGVAWYSKQEDGPRGLINTKGTIITKPRFEYVGRFNQENRASASITKDDDEVYGIINQHGDWIVKPQYNGMEIYFADTLIVVRNDDYDELVIDQNGKVVLETPSDAIELSAECQRIWSGYSNRDFYDWEGNKIDVLSSKYSWFGYFDESCDGLAYNNTHWGRVDAEGLFTPFPDEVVEPCLDNYDTPVEFNGTFMPALNQERRLVYVNQDKQIAFRAEVHKSPTADTLLLKTPEGKLLWQADFPAGSLHQEHPFFFNAGNRDIGFDESWLRDITPVVQQLQSDKPRYFNASIPRPYEVSTSDYSYASFGTAAMLGHHYLSETQWGQYDFLGYRDPVSENYEGVKAQLIQRYGKPLGLDEALEYELAQLNLSAGDSGYSDDSVTVWDLDGSFLVLCDFKLFGDGDITTALSLSLLMPKDKQAQPEAIDLSNVHNIETSEESDEYVHELVRALPDNGDNARVIRDMVIKVHALVEAGQNISEYDYLWTLYSLLRFAYPHAEGGMSEQESIEVANTAINYLNEHGVGSWVYTEVGQFKMEVYRAAGNSAAWTLRNSAPEKALAYIEPALEYARDEDTYLQDTYVRVLLNLGEDDRAYAIVKAVLEADPDFSDFQDFHTDEDYQRWLQSK